MRAHQPIIGLFLVLTICGMIGFLAWREDAASAKQPNTLVHKEFVAVVDGCNIWELETRTTRRMLVATQCKELAK